MRFPLNNKIDLDSIPAANRFGARRKFDVHTGVDLFAPEGTPVYACQDGEVIDVCTFTGASIGMPWWNETECAAIKGASGVILYGEITSFVYKGDKVQEGDLIGLVKQVLIKDKGKPMSMLHIEWYEADYKGKGFEDNVWEAWELDGDKPPKLKNIEELIFDNPKTPRGFRINKFEDINGNECVIQKSSLATQDAIWLGSATLKVQHFKAGDGWKDVVYPHTMTEHYVGNERMHLNREQVAKLLPILQKFVETGEI